MTNIEIYNKFQDKFLVLNEFLSQNTGKDISTTHSGGAYAIQNQLNEFIEKDKHIGLLFYRVDGDSTDGVIRFEIKRCGVCYFSNEWYASNDDELLQTIRDSK